MSREEAASIVDLSKLPEDASETLHIVRYDFNDGVWRVRWKVIAKQ